MARWPKAGLNERYVTFFSQYFDRLTICEGTLVSQLADDETVNIDNVKWILVVEKEARCGRTRLANDGH